MEQTNAIHEYVGQIIDDIVAASSVENTPNIKNKIKTKGAGAGGAHTNKNGLPYEELTDLKTEYTVVSADKCCQHIQFPRCENKKTWVATGQFKFFKCMDPYINKTVEKAHGCKNPDECYIDHQTKTIFILEKKFQQVSGSVCEKSQTSDFKIWQYSRTFPAFHIVYMYCLSDWFKLNCKAELEYLEQKNVPVFWGNDANYKSKIIDFMTNYQL